MLVFVYFTVAKQHGSLELKSAWVVCGCWMVVLVYKGLKLIRPHSGKKAVLHWEDWSSNKRWAWVQLSCLYYYYLQSWWRIFGSVLSRQHNYCMSILSKKNVSRQNNECAYLHWNTLGWLFSSHCNPKQVLYTCRAEACCDTHCMSVFKEILRCTWKALWNKMQRFWYIKLYCQYQILNLNALLIE